MAMISCSKINLKHVYTIVLIAIAVFGYESLYAQDLTKEVYVVSSYRPEIADVDKISSMPELTDTFSFNPTIDYTILPSRIKSDYSLRPIKAANMVGTPLDKLYNSHLKVGFGNYTTPLIEYSIQNLRSKEYAVGAYVFHKSSYSKLTLPKGTEVPDNYARNNLAFYGKKFYRKFNLVSEVGGTRNSFMRYGINENSISTDSTDDGFDIDKKDIKQNYNKVYAKAGIHSTQPDSGRMDYRLFVTGNYFWDRFKNKEPHVKIKGNINFPVNTFNVSMDGQFDYYNLKDTLNTDKTMLYTFQPLLRKRKDQWSVKVGGRISVLHHDSSKIYVYPDIDFRFKVINNALSAFLGVSGYLEHHSFEKLSAMNPYMLPGQHVRATNHPYIFYVGVDGSINKKASYRFDLSYEAISDMAFFVTYEDTLNNLWNEFKVVTDDPDRLKLHLEFSWTPLENLGFYLQSNYYSYTLYDLDQAWHMPKVDLTFTTRYNFREKVYAELDFITMGKRYATSFHDMSSLHAEEGFGAVEELAPIYDLNLKLEYKYSDILSFFLHGYNLINQHYYFWNQYRSQGFNLLGGVSYKF